MMDIVMTMAGGLLTFIKTPVGLGIVIVAIMVILRAVVKATKTTADDKWLAKYGKAVYTAAGLAEKAIPDGTQIVALKFIDEALGAIAKSGEVDITDKKLITVVKAQLINVAKASTKVNTTPEELLKLKN